MKKIKGSLLAILLAGIAIFAFMSVNTIDKNNAILANGTSAEGYFDTFYKLESIDDLIILSDYVVMGKAESVEKHGVVNENHSKYVFKVEQFFKGYEYSDRIDVYTLNDEIEVGSEYVLFLSYRENEFTPNPIHALIYHDTNIKLNYNTLVGNEKYINDMNKEQLIDYISRSPLLKQTTMREYSIRNKANDFEDLINYSDYIVHVIPKYVEQYNLDVSLVDVIILEQFKGEKLKITTLLLPPNIKEGEEYLLFLKDRNSATRLATRSDSIIEKIDKERWAETISNLKR